MKKTHHRREVKIIQELERALEEIERIDSEHILIERIRHEIREYNNEKLDKFNYQPSSGRYEDERGV